MLQKKKKERGKSVQQLLGIRGFSRYGLLTDRGELLFFQLAPTNISVLSRDNIELRINALRELLRSFSDLELVCTDAAECFDANKAYLRSRAKAEANPKVREFLKKDVQMLDHLQLEMASAREFYILCRCRNQKPEQVFSRRNEIAKAISEKGFESRPLDEAGIKRMLALFFGTSLYGERLPDVDGAQFFKEKL